LTTTGQEGAVTATDRIYLDLLQRLGGSDLTAIAVAKDLPLEPGHRLRVKSFARSYLLDRSGVTAVDAGPVSFQQKLAVLSYALSEGAGEPSFEFVPLGRLGGFNIGRDRFDDRGLKRPLLARFADDYDLLARASLRLGGIEKEGGRSGEHVWLFHAFPKIPIQLTFHERDEDFPADVHVLFDSRALDFLGLECLGFLPAHFAESLLTAAAAVDD